MNKLVMFIFWGMFIVLLLVGCKTIYTPPNCITSDYSGFLLEWGYDDSNLNEMMYYSLNEKGYINFIRKDRQSKAIKTDSVCRIDGERVCRLLFVLNLEMLKTPIINEPGKRLTFIMLTKPAVDMQKRFVWNEFSTHGSKGYRDLFDTLMAAVKMDGVKG